MKHKVQVIVESKKKGFFGTKTVREKKTIEVDGKTYRKMKKDYNNRPYSVEEMALYDDIFD